LAVAGVLKDKSMKYFTLFYFLFLSSCHVKTYNIDMKPDEFIISSDILFSYQIEQDLCFQHLIFNSHGLSITSYLPSDKNPKFMMTEYNKLDNRVIYKIQKLLNENNYFMNLDTIIIDKDGILPSSPPLTIFTISDFNKNRAIRIKDFKHTNIGLKKLVELTNQLRKDKEFKKRKLTNYYRIKGNGANYHAPAAAK
jgi:hypothetical protein